MRVAADLTDIPPADAAIWDFGAGGGVLNTKALQLACEAARFFGGTHSSESGAESSDPTRASDEASES